jgi:hypothetical protein
VVVFESAAALCLIVTLASVVALLRTRTEFCEERARSATLETVPLEWFRWRPNRPNADAHDKTSGYRQFLARLQAADAERLEKARQGLNSGGTAFSTTCVTRSGAVYAVEGRRAASGDAVLWLLDASAAVTVQRARQEVADLRQMLDAIPLPVWRRGPDRILLDLQPSLCDRPRHDRRSGCRGRPGIGFRRPPWRMPARGHRRLAPAGRDRRGAMLGRRHNRFRL